MATFVPTRRIMVDGATIDFPIHLQPGDVAMFRNCYFKESGSVRAATGADMTFVDCRFPNCVIPCNVKGGSING